MPQERGLYRYMRVIDQLTGLARLHGLDKGTGEARASSLLEQLGLADRADDKILKLSGGMAQRVQLAASIVHEPDLLVLDELFAAHVPVAVHLLSPVILAQFNTVRNLLFSRHYLDIVPDSCQLLPTTNH